MNICLYERVCLLYVHVMTNEMNVEILKSRCTHVLTTSLIQLLTIMYTIAKTDSVTAQLSNHGGWCWFFELSQSLVVIILSAIRF